MKTYKGDCVSSVYDVINVSLAQHGLRIDPVAEATIEEICEVLANAETAEFECVCEQKLGLVLCSCGVFYCADCRKDHVHQDGYQA